MHGDEKPRDNDYLTGENQHYFAVRLMEQVAFDFFNQSYCDDQRSFRNRMALDFFRYL